MEDDGVGIAAAQSYEMWKEKAAAKRRSSGLVTRKRLELLNKTKGHDSQKKTYKKTDLTNAQQTETGTKTELWIPILYF